MTKITAQIVEVNSPTLEGGWTEGTSATEHYPAEALPYFYAVKELTREALAKVSEDQALEFITSLVLLADSVKPEVDAKVADYKKKKSLKPGTTIIM